MVGMGHDKNPECFGEYDYEYSHHSRRQAVLCQHIVCQDCQGLSSRAGDCNILGEDDDV